MICQFWIVILTLILVSSCGVIIPPVLIWRIVVIVCAKLFRPDLVSIVSGWDLVFGRDFQNWHTNPETVILMTTAQWKNNDSPEKARQFFQRILQDPNYKRLRQYIVPFMGYAFWQEEKHFDIDHHVKVHTSSDSQPVDEKGIIRLKKELLKLPFGKNKSPWEFIIVPNYKFDGNLNREHSYSFFRAHHALGDGISFTEIVYKMCERPSASIQEPKVELKKVNFFSKMLKLIYLTVKMPYDFVKTKIEADDYDKTPWCTKPNKFTGCSSYAKSKPMTVDEIKTIRRKFSVSFASVILYGVTSMIRNLMIAKNIKIPDIIYCQIPFPLSNHPEEMCNHMTAALFPLPIGVSEPSERIKRINEEFINLKTSSVTVSWMWFLKILTCFPCWVVQNTEQFITLVVSIYNCNPNYRDIYGSNMVEKGFALSVPAPMINSGITIGVLSYDNSVVTYETNVDTSIIESDEMVEEIHELMYKEFKDLQL